MIKHECVECGYLITSPEELAGEEITCPSCQEITIVPYGEPDNQEDDYEEMGVEDIESSLFTSEEHRYINKADAEPYQRKKGWLKNFVAIFIGIVTSLILGFILILLATAFCLIFRIKSGIPPDIFFLLRIFTAFIAGAIAGSLVPRLGWLIGALTQVVYVFPVAILIFVFLVVTDADVSSLPSIETSEIRFFVIAILVSGIAGTIGQKFRKNIWSFLGKIFGFIAGTFIVILHAVGVILYLYFLYRGGKALFEDGSILKALLWWVVIGPIFSYGSFLLLLGVFMGGGWVFKKIYNWYLPDLGFEKMEDWY